MNLMQLGLHLAGDVGCSGSTGKSQLKSMWKSKSPSVQVQMITDYGRITFS